jgi:hypothetical protein
MSQHQMPDRSRQAHAPEDECDTATPPVCRSPMPTQVIEYWTPAAVAAAALRAVAVLLRPSVGDRGVSRVSEPDEHAQ